MQFEATPEVGTAEVEVNSSTVYDSEELVDYETGNIKDAELIQAGERKYQEVMANPDYATWTDASKAELANKQRPVAWKEAVYDRAYSDAVSQAMSDGEAKKFAADAAQTFAQYHFDAVGRTEQAAKNASPESLAV